MIISGSAPIVGKCAGKPRGEVLRTPGVRSTSPQGLLQNPHTLRRTLFRKRRRRLEVLPALAIQGVQERDQIGLVLLAELERLDVLVQPLVLDAPLVVVLDDFFERL